MKKNSAAGADGWTVGELLALPDGFLNQLSQILNLVETTGEWPEALAEGVISLITKGEGASPTDLRPIGVMSTIYRAWAAARVRDLMGWQQDWIDSNLHGFRSGHAPEDVWWQIGLEVEKSLLTGEPLVGLVLDWSKCFDRVPVDLVLRLSQELGMPEGVLNGLSGMYAQLRRRFRIGGHVGTAFRASNGIIQGCPLSVMLLNILMNVWARAVRSEAPEVTPAVFADDVGAYTSSVSAAQRALAVTGRFATITRQRLNTDKSKVWATTAESRSSLNNLTLQGKPLQQTKGSRIVGAHLRFTYGERNTTGEKRVENGIVIAKRIRWAPLPMFLRAKLIASLVNPGSLYGYPVAGLPQVSMNAIRSAVMSAVWGTRRKLRCRELVFTLLVPGHLVDPVQFAAYNSLWMLRCMLRKRPELREVFLQVWQHRDANSQRVPGPGSIVASIVRRLGWYWHDPDFFERPGKRRLPLTQGDDNWWKHEVREGLRIAEWRSAAKRRLDCAGMDALTGIDKLSTCALLNSSSTTHTEKGDLRSILSGSVRFGERLCEAGIWHSSICPFCRMAPESLVHVWWHCPAWQHLRFDPDLPVDSTRRAWPQCSQSLGVFVEDEQLHAFQQQDIAGGEVPEADPQPWQGHETQEDGHIVVWTDGACRNNQDSRLRRAGAGVYYGRSHPNNIAFALPGECQTNQRAELFAVILALSREDRALEVRTDSKWVFEGASAWETWRHSGWVGDHCDLWHELSSLMQVRISSLRFTKVKGHAEQHDVDNGHARQIDKDGNDGADAVAVRGARHHAAPEQLSLAAAKRKSCAMAVHKMMLRILHARRAAEASLGLEGYDAFEQGDRGSEADATDLLGASPGDFPWDLG